MTYDSTRNIATSQGDDCVTGCLLDYNYLQNYYKMIAVDFCKQQVLDADPKAVQQIYFTGNIAQQTTTFFITEEAKETVLYFSQGIVKVF